MTDIKANVVDVDEGIPSEEVASDQGTSHWPILRLAGHLEGVSKRDVYDYLKGLMQRHFDEHKNERAFVSLLRWNNGWLYELCLGGDGKSRLKAMANFLEASPPETRLRLPAGQRFGEVYLHKEGRVVYRLLPENENVSADELPASGHASKLYPTYHGVLISGVTLFLFGCSLLALSFAAAKAGAVKQEREEMAQQISEQQARIAAHFQQLPITNMPSVTDLLDEPQATEYVEAVRFERGEWLPPQIGCVGNACPPAALDN